MAEGCVPVAAAAGAFAYNRENFLYDSEFRWERFCSAREYANQQAEQYREDLRNLASLTMKKNTLWIITATLSMEISTALYCAGRLGLHGPSPPSWLMGLWLTNNAAAWSFMSLCVFLALHSSFRAQAASTHLLTRKVRVPVPTLKQLDQARRFASEFEQQSVRDILRVPFMMDSRAPQTDDAVYDGELARDSGGSAARRSRSAPSGRRSCSSWIKEEFQQDRAGGGGAAAAPDAAPEHFQLYAAIQKEFYQHDIYSRVCIFLGFNCYIQSLCFYGLGHTFIELRAFWVAFACVFVLAVLQALILRFDIIPANKSRKQFFENFEFFGPLCMLPTAIALALDYRVQFDRGAITASWVFVFFAYGFELLYTLRLLEIVLPDAKFGGLGERLGASWLPDAWRMVPSSFYHVLYVVAPPERLQPGQHDLLREIKVGGAGAYDEVVGGGKKGSRAGGTEPILPVEEEATHEMDDRRYHHAMPSFARQRHVEPWKLVAALVGMLCAGWVFMIVGTIVDCAIGDQALVGAHPINPPMTRLSLTPLVAGAPLGGPWPAGAKPFLPESFAWHEELHAAHGHHRRLAGREMKASGTELSAALHDLLSLMPLAEPGA